MTTLLDPAVDAARAIAAAHATTPGGLLPALHGIQDRLGYIPPASVPAIADAFNLSRAEVHGVITYYHHFRSQPAGRHVVQICRAESCQAMGSDALLAHVEQRLGCREHETSADGKYTLEPVYCLGLCASSPAISIDEQPRARVTPEKFDRLLGRLEHDA